MSAPRWTTWLLRRVAPEERADDLLGDLEEAHHRRVEARGRVVAAVLTSLEALDIALMLFLRRLRSRHGPPVSWLDFKLGARMLVRYPGLTLVAGFAMAFAIWCGASAFEFFQQTLRPTLPLDEGDRIVSVVTWDAASNRPEERLAREFLAWREQVRSLDELSVYRSADRNLVVGEAAYPVAVAEISPSAFRLARVAPLHGRFLVEEDERIGAASVVVLGFDVWRSRFGADPGVIGRTVRLGAEEATVVGVMPEGFAFPVSHEAWTPLRLDAAAYAPREGPAIQLFGRLADGFSLTEARAELSTLAVQAPGDAPEAEELLRTDVVPYGSRVLGLEALAGIIGFNLLPILLLLLISATVALLMFARAAAREGELAVRTALGASRRRIVGQLFVEALVLGALAAVVGLLATGVGLRWLIGMWEAEVLDGGSVPFWVDDQVSLTTVAYVAFLTVLGAFVAGAGPALKLTRGVGGRLKQATAGGGGVKLGGVWTAVVVVQVAFTVVFPTVALAVFREGMERRDYPIAIEGEEFLAVQVRMDRQPGPGEAADTSLAAFVAAYQQNFRELEERISQDPEVLGVTYAERLPRTYHGWHQVEVDVGAVQVEDPRGHRVGRAPVDVDYFDVLDAPVLQGRDFTLADVESDARVVIVDQPFVDRVLGGANPIGRRIRYIAGESLPPQPPEGGPWYEIVGLASDLGVRRGGQDYGGIYHPTRPGLSYPLRLVLHVRGDPEALVPSLRAAAAAVDSRIRLYEPLPLDEPTRYSEDAFYDFWITLAFVVSGVALLISLAAIYSVMSFTVVRRTREIGVRVALGGRASKVIGAVLAGPVKQVAAGVALGILLTIGLRSLTFDDVASTVLIVAAYRLLMLAVCATASIVPTRRALSIQPTEALRADG